MQNQSSNPDYMLYIVLMERKNAEKKERRVVCIAPSSKNLLCAFAKTYTTFYWCDEYCVQMAKHHVLAQLYAYASDCNMAESYMAFYGELLHNILLFHTQKQTVSHNTIDRYVVTVLKRYETLFISIKNHTTTMFSSIISAITASVYYILCDIMRYKIPKPIQTTLPPSILLHCN